MKVQALSKKQQSSRLKLGWRAFVLLLAYSFVWYVLTGSDRTSWIIGLPVVLLAAAVSLFLRPRTLLVVNPLSALLFIPYFIFFSILSGIDVLRRTFSPGPRINPGILSYRTRLQGSSRILLVNVISLLPGTLSADLKGAEISIHVLDTTIPVQKNIENLESRIAQIFPQQHAFGEQT